MRRVNPAARGLKPAAELAARRPHGTRMRYLGGCRCQPCKTANTEYEKARYRERRNGNGNGIVSAQPAREHIKKLSRAGVGYKMVADSARVAVSVVFGIKNGTRIQARSQTVKRILQVTIDCRGDNTLVSAASTWRRIEKLQEEGFSKSFLSKQLGHKGHSLQIGKHQVTVRNRARIEKLFEKLTT